MRRALVHPRLFTRGVGPFLQRRATILTATETRSPTGQINRTWAALPEHADMPVAISALNAYQRATYTGSDTRIMLPGYHPDVTTKMRIQTDDGASYDINAVDHAYGQATRLVVQTNIPGGPD